MRKKKELGEYTFGRSLAWSSRSISQAVNMVLLLQLTYFCTNALGLAPGLVGTLLLVSKLFDGFTDLVAGVIIDKTKTRWGKARPYELCILGVWLTAVLLFSCPNWGTAGKAVFVFLGYTLNSSVFVTLEAASEAVFLRRAFKDNASQAKVLSLSGVLTMIFSTAAGIALPILIGMWGSLPGGWTRIALVYAVPFGILGTIRFLLIKEMPEYAEETSSAPQIPLKEAAKMLFANKYVVILAVVLLLQNLIVNIGSAIGNYYAQYILGSIELNSLIAMIGIFVPFALIILPMLMKKASLMKISGICTILAAAGYLLKLVSPSNLIVIIIASIVTGLAALPLNMMHGILTIECIDYGAWKSKVSGVEGVYSSITGFAGKVGSGLASSVVGIVMGIAGFDGQAAVQTASANTSIILLASVIPAVLLLVQFLFIRRYDLGEKIGQIRAELEERRHGAKTIAE